MDSCNECRRPGEVAGMNELRSWWAYAKREMVLDNILEKTICGLCSCFCASLGAGRKVSGDKFGAWCCDGPRCFRSRECCFFSPWSRSHSWHVPLVSSSLPPQFFHPACPGAPFSHQARTPEWWLGEATRGIQQEGPGESEQHRSDLRRRFDHPGLGRQGA